IDNDTEGVVLLFDQFEEVLAHDPTDIKAKDEFFSTVASCLAKCEDGVPWLAVFSLREEFLAALDPYRRHFPNRLVSRYRLELLKFDATNEAIVGPAVDAVCGPAAAAGVEFHPSAVRKLI